MRTAVKPHYPTRAKVTSAVASARASDIDVGAIELAPDGTIRIFDLRACPKVPKDEFEEWEQSGKLG